MILFLLLPRTPQLLELRGEFVYLVIMLTVNYFDIKNSKLLKLLYFITSLAGIIFIFQKTYYLVTVLGIHPNIIDVKILVIMYALSFVLELATLGIYLLIIILNVPKKIRV